MIIKDFFILKKRNGHKHYASYKDFVSFEKRLNILWNVLNPIEDLEMEIDIIDEKNIVYIYSSDSIKEQADVDLESDKEENNFLKRYISYSKKRWKEIPKLTISISDWKHLQKKWLQVKNKNPKVIVFELDDSGPLDKVDVYGKDELSQEDINYIEQEHEKYLKYEKARQRYIANHPDYSEVWRGPQDDEYEADIMKYYDQD